MADKKLIGAAALAGALGLGGIVGAALGSPGVSGAQETPTTVEAPDTTADTPPAPPADAPPGMPADGPRGEHLQAAADALGLDLDAVSDALADGTTLAELADQQGVDVQDVIDAIVADSEDELVDRVTAFVNGELPGPGMGGFGHGGGPVGFGVVGDLDTAADAIGISADDLRTALQEDGATLASVAEANGVDAQTLIDALVAEATSHLDEAVADGDLTQEEADAITADLPDRIADLVNGELPAGPGGHGGGFPGGGPGFGPGGFGPGGPGAPATGSADGSESSDSGTG